MAKEDRQAPPAALLDAISTEEPDFLVRTERMSGRRSIRRLIVAGIISSALAFMLLSIFLGPSAIVEPQGSPGERTFMIVFWNLPAIAFFLIALAQWRSEGAWLAGTRSELLLWRKGRLDTVAWTSLPPVVAWHRGPAGGTAVIGEGLATSVGQRLRRPGIYVPNHAEARAVAESAWRRIAHAQETDAQGLLQTTSALLDAPPEVQHVAREADPDFVVKARRHSPFSFNLGKIVFALGFCGLGLVVFLAGVAGFVGYGVMTTTVDGQTVVVPPGSPDHVYMAAFGIAWSLVGLFFTFDDIIAPWFPGPWFVGTQRGLVTVTPTTTRWHAWSVFAPGATRPHLTKRQVYIDFKPNVYGHAVESDGHGGRREAGRGTRLYLAGIDDADMIAAAIDQRVETSFRIDGPVAAS